MTISSTIRKAGPFTGTGLATTYPFAFKVFQASDVLVQQVDTSGNVTTLVLTSNYSVTLNGDQNGNPGGNVVLNSALATGYTLVIGSQVPQTQSTLLTNNGGFYPQVITDALDRLTILIQQQQQTIGGALQLPFAVTGVSTVLPAPSNLQLIGWNATGTALQNINPSTLGTAIQGTTWHTDVFTGTGAQTTFTLSNSTGGTFAIMCSVGGVSQIPGVDFTVTGTTLTFTVAPPNGLKIACQYGQAVAASGAVDLTNVVNTLAIANGGTGATSAAAARTALGLVIGTNVAAAGANSDITSMSALASVTVLTSINGGQLAGLRNRTINGDMRIDQRNSGTSQTIVAAAAAAYTVDRFYATCTGANVTGQRVAGSGPDQYLYQFTGAASVTGIAFGQRIEATNVYDLTSQTATFSCKIANSLLTTVTWTAYYPNSADNWTSRTQIATGTFTVTSTLTKYSAQIALGANVIAGLEIELSVGSQISGTWQMTEWQLELGSTATVFERRPIGLETFLAQRYFFQYLGGTGVYGGVVSNTPTTSGSVNIAVTYALPVTMRVTPTTGGSPGWSQTNTSVSTVAGMTPNTFYVISGNSNSPNLTATYYLTSGTLTFSAEL